MSKEEFLKIQTCVLKVNIHCDGCKRKVKKILQKIDGVYKINIDSDLGKVTVSGNVDPPTLIKKLGKNGKHAELWGAPKPNQNPQNQIQNQLKNLQIDNGKGGNGINPPKGGQNGQKGMSGGGNNPPIGGQNSNIPNQQQLQQQMKALQDMKLPQLKDLKMPMGPPFGNNNNKCQNQKHVKFDLPKEEEDLSDGEFDDEFDDDEDDFDDDEMDDDDDMDELLPNHPLNKAKPMMGNGQVPNMMMNPEMMAKIGNVGGGGGQNGKKSGPAGGSGSMTLPVIDGKDGKKGGSGGGDGNGNKGQMQNGGKNGKGGGGEGKMGNNGGEGKMGNKGNGGGQNGNLNMNGGKKGSGVMSDGIQGLANMGGAGMGQLGNMPMGSMGQMSTQMPMGQMGQIPAVQGLPSSAIYGGGGGYFAGGPPDMVHQQQQQQLAAMMMNQQRANGNERFQPMMYARPPPAVNYMPPYPYPYPYPYPPPGEPDAHAFSDENSSSCNVM